MSTPSYIQPSFTGGELSPELRSRVDLQKYSSGLALAKNFFIQPQGGVSNRPGLKYVATAKTPGSKARIIPFVFSATEAYIIELGHQYARFFRNGAAVARTAKEFAGGVNYQKTFCAKSGYYKIWDWGSGHALILFTKSTYTPSSALRVVVSNALASGSPQVGYSETGGVVTLVQITLSDTDANNTLANLRAELRKYAALNDFDVAGDPQYAAGYPSGLPIGAATLYTMTQLSGTYYALTDNSYDIYVTDAATWAPYTTAPIFEVTLPYNDSDLTELKYAQSADVLYLVHPDYPPYRLTRYDNDDWRLDLYPFEGGPFMPSNSTISNTITSSATGKMSSTTLTATTDIFDSSHVGALFRLRHDVEGPVTVNDYAAVSAVSPTLKCGGTWRLVTRGTWTGVIALQKSTDGSTWVTVRSFYHNGDDANWNTYGTEDDQCQVRLYMTAFTSGLCTATLSCDSFVQTGIVKITSVTTPRVATGVIQSEIGGTTATWEWAEGSWSDYRGYPSSVTFYQDRLCFANTYSEPQTVWMSETGNYVSFARNLPLEDTDGVSINLPSQKLNGVKDMVALSKILAFTSSSEWAVGPAGSGVVTPTSASAECQGYRGSANVQPLPIGNRIVFAQAQSSVVRDLGYALESDGFSGDNISIVSSHLLKGKTIVAMAYQQEPDSLIWVVLNDGTFLSCTYMREQEVIAWAQHTTDGIVEDICCIPSEGYDEVYFLVRRTINSVQYRYIERMASRWASTDPKEQFFVDAGYDYSGAATATLSGLTWLAGKAVSVLADGSVVPNCTISSGGVLTLTNAATRIIVGLPYTCDFETLSVEIQTNAGTLQGKTVKIPGVTFRFLNSRGGYIGSTFTAARMDELIQRTNEPYDTAMSLFSGDYRATLDSSYGDGGHVCYRQKDPLPVTISAVIPKIHPGG